MCSKDLVKLAKLYYADDYSDVKDILDSDGDINYVAANDPYLEKYKPELLGGNICHFRLEIHHSRESDFKILFEHGVDCTIKNNQGRTVLHQVFRKAQYYVDYRNSITFKNNFQKWYFEVIDAVLSAHVASSNASNPRDDYGITHFHAACLTNNVRAVRFFLRNGVSVNEAVNVDAPIFSGYTPLHFAASRCYYRTAEVLLKRGADVHLRDSRGFTSLHIVLEQYYVATSSKYERWRRAYPTKVKLRDKSENVLILLLSKIDNFVIDEYGLTCLHVACCTKDTKLVKSYLKKTTSLDNPISMDSPLFPGFTALHFAALFSPDTFKFLLAKGADILVKDKNGLSPFDICVEEYKIEDICAFITSVAKLRNIVLSDGRTKLMDFIFAMRYPNEFFSFFKLHKLNPNVIVPTNSPLWPGFTILHLAVVFSERIVDNLADEFRKPKFAILNVCLRRGANFDLKNKDGLTALHLAFHQQKIRVVHCLLENYSGFGNLVDDYNLSHLHIACATGNDNVVKRLATSGTNVNDTITSNLSCFKSADSFYSVEEVIALTRGSTALHIVVTARSLNSAKMLIENGANLYATDANGFTPVHLLFPIYSSYDILRSEFNFMLSSLELVDIIASSCGLSHLHIAVLSEDTNAIKKLLDNGANVNQRICLPKVPNVADEHKSLFCAGVLQKTFSELSNYNGYTPLDLSMYRGSDDITKILLERGADVFVEDADGKTALHHIFHDYRVEFMNEVSLIDRLRCDEIFRTRIEKCTGLTMLHFACRILDVEWVEDLLRRVADVNAKTLDVGNTPLHVCRELSDRRSLAVIRLLLEHGADVMLTNNEGDTPVMSLASLGRHDPDDGTLEEGLIFNLLLESQKDFSVNPVNSKGISHFHIACARNHPPVIEKFLKHDIDVNQPINYLWRGWYEFGGVSPLHMTLRIKYKLPDDLLEWSKTIDLLLANGADVNAEDGRGYTPLHYAAAREQSRHVILEKLMQAGADMEKKNIYGHTPFETLLCSKNVTAEDFKCFLSRGYKIDDYRAMRKVSYISMIIQAARHHRSQKGFDEMLKILDVTKKDMAGRTALHNTVAAWDCHVHSAKCPIEDCSLDYEYNYNVSYNIQGLVCLGCDVDQQDNEGKTALHVATEVQNPYAVTCLLKNGADVNLTDSTGKPAFYVYMNQNQLTMTDDAEQIMPIDHSFIQHIKLLHLFKLDVSQLNLEVRNYFQRFVGNVSMIELSGEIEAIQNQCIGSSTLKLKHFLSETGIVANYPHLSINERRDIDEFFESIDENRFTYTIGLLRLQYRKAMKRAALLESANNVFRLLIRFSLPYLCCEAVMKFLSNTDLKNMIAAMTNRS